MLAPVSGLSIESCLEPETVRHLLQHALPDVANHRVKIDGLRVVSARRNASRRRDPHPLTLCYELDVHDELTGTLGKRRYYAKVFRDGASAGAAPASRALHLPQLDMLLWAWPDDPGLPQLSALLDPGQTLRWWGEPAQRVCALRYVPEWRATLRYTRTTHATPGQASKHLFAKTFGNESGAAIYRRFVHFWDLARSDARAPLVAQPLGYSAETRTLWQAQAAGKPLLQALASPAVPLLAEGLAYAIAMVHASPPALAGEPPRDTAYWLTEIHRRRKKITRAVPDLAGRAARVTDVMAQAALQLPPHAPAVIHGDFHADQIWVDGERIVLFDFDEFVLGDPMEDLAEFVTKLSTDADGAALGRQLVRAYRRISPQQFCKTRLQWHLALQQLLQTSRAFVFQVSDWRGEVERRLTRLEASCVPMSMGVMQ